MSDLKQKLQEILLEEDEFAYPNDTFITIESELRTNARQMGIDYDNAFIVNTGVSSDKWLNNNQKWNPPRWWAGYGSSWLDWISGEMPEWLRPYFYVLDVDTTNIVNVNSKASKILFGNAYVTKPMHPKDIAIDFNKMLERGKTGVSFRPYNKSWRDMKNYTDGWYDSIDVDSIVIVDKSAIRSIKLLLDASEILQDAKNGF
jgi:hypothetical protein